MTSSTSSNSPYSPSPPPSPSALAQELMRFVRLVHVLKGRIAGVAPSGLEYAAVGLLTTLVKRGALRQGELAEAALLDPSTVSRHVGQLVRAGLVERRPDPDDGRAVQLIASTQGRALDARLSVHRNQMICGVVAGWDEQEVNLLAQLMHRLNNDFESHRQSIDLTDHQKTLHTMIEQEL